MTERPRDDLPMMTREGKPRDKGITIANDHLGTLDKDLLQRISEMVDYAKMGLSLPVVIEKSKLLERVRMYHDLGIKVMSGGTLIQVALKKRILSPVLERLHSLGFDTVEISESASELSTETKQDILNAVAKYSLDYFFEVGKKDQAHPTPPSYLIAKIQEAFDLKSPKVVIEAGEGTGVGIYDSGGGIAWDTLNEIVGRFGPPNLIFEAPKLTQRSALVLEFGPNVNLASIPLEDVLLLEMQRLGLTTETLGLSPPIQSVEGSPAAKFVYHLIKTEHPIDQATLMQRSGLPKRTLQAALSYLVESGYVREVSDMSDLRRHKYTPR